MMLRLSDDHLVVIAYGYAASDRDAVARVVEDLAGELRSRGQNVVVIGIRPEKIVVSGGNAVAKLARLRSELRFLWSSAAFVVRHRRRISVFISVDVPSGLPFVGTLARQLTRKRIQDIAWVMDLYRLSREKAGRVDRARARLELAALRSSGAIVTIGQCMSTELFTLTAKPVGVIPLWHRDVTATAVGDRTAPLRLLYSGSARDIHPLLPLVQAVGGRDDVELHINGSGSEVDRVDAYLASTPLRNVHVNGFVADTELAGAYAAADMHVVALDESATATCVPSKVYAAMASARGVLYLGSEAGQAARDVLAAGSGIVVPASSGTAIGEAIDRLVSDRGRVRSYGVNARRFFDEERDLRAGGRRWTNLLSGPTGDGATAFDAG
jgi:colanic acid biosynthesis glycosyl transferase WcaI